MLFCSDQPVSVVSDRRRLGQARRRERLHSTTARRAVPVVCGAGLGRRAVAV